MAVVGVKAEYTFEHALKLKLDVNKFHARCCGYSFGVFQHFPPLSFRIHAINK